MRQFIATVFDDYVAATQAVATPSIFDAMLAVADELVVQVLVRRVGGVSPTLSLLLDRSNDARLWNEGEILLSGVPLEAGTTNRFWAASSTVLGGFCRLRVLLGGTGPRCSVSVLVCARDSGARGRAAERPRRLGLGFAHVRPRFLPACADARGLAERWMPDAGAQDGAADSARPEAVNRGPAFWSSPSPDDPNAGQFVR